MRRIYADLKRCELEVPRRQAPVPGFQPGEGAVGRGRALTGGCGEYTLPPAISFQPFRLKEKENGTRI